MARDFDYGGKFTFVDVEIPNINNDKICAISIIVVENHQIVLRHTELIDPKTFFSSYNVNIHGITQKQVRKARTLERYWKDYGRYFGEEYIIGAHNTLSDISVLNKDLARFKEKIRAKKYIDTMDIMSRFYFQGSQKSGDLRLDNIARRLGIAIDHHNPESDVNACFEIVRFMAHIHDMPLEPFVKDIPEKIGKRERHKHTVNSHSSLRRYIATIRKEISSKDPRLDMDRRMAEIRGHKAYMAKQYKDAILFYELAIYKKTRNPEIYLRLSRIYENEDFKNEAISILERGIKELRRVHVNYQPLSRQLKKLKAKQNKKAPDLS